MSNINIKNIYSKIKPFIYCIWFACITLIVIRFYQAGIGTNTQGSSCDPYSWQEGKIYQWVWEKQPCTYTFDFLIGYVFYVMLYLMFDYVRRLIIGFNPGIGWRLFEIAVWFCLNWAYLLRLTIIDYGAINPIMLETSFLGTLQFFLPLFLLATSVRFFNSRAVLWTFFGIMLAYCGMIFYAISEI